MIFQALGVYFNLYYLLPRFFRNERILLYVFYTILTILVSTFLVTAGYYVSAYFSNQSFETLFGRPTTDFLYFFKNQALPSSAASMTLAMSVKLGKNWFESQKRQQVLEREKLVAELKYLKSQFNPHFLFNTINSIFVLISKDPNTASQALVKFSDLLRYQLYDCNEQQVNLITEIEYLENFINLERLRYNQNLKLDIETPLIIAPHLKIAPFILTTLLENAFKHVSMDKNDLFWIKFHVHLKGENLEINCSNSTASIWTSNQKEGGIGLKNIKRRLELLYPEKHKLDIINKSDSFEVKLWMSLQTKLENEQANLMATWN